MSIKRSVLAPLIVSGMALATGGWFLQQGVSQEQNVYVQAKVFQEIINRVTDNFVESKSQSDLYEMAIDGMLEELGDPHTSFMTPKDYNQLKVQTTGEYGGLGIQILKRDGWITVVTPLPGTPAERAGIQAGDQIIEFNGRTTKDWDSDAAVDTLRGPKGTQVELKLKRPGMDAPITMKLTRAEIHVRAVPAAYMLDNNTGYVELTMFSESSTDELRTAINTLKKQGMKSLVLDLRANPGGLLDQGVTVSDLFLDKGLAVVETRGRVQSQNQKATASDPDEFPGLPITVLVGPGTASAAEIVAGALQDHDRALVIGRTSYGKGSVQQVFPLSNQNYLKMTTARWYTPVGRSIQGPYGIDAQAAGDGDEGASTNAAPQDSVGKKPAFKTASGRTVYGGGGIHPDIVIMDTLSASEQVLAKALQANFNKYLDARFRYAVAFIRENPSLQPGFPVTPKMLADFYNVLSAAGIKVERPVYDAGSAWVATGLGYEISFDKWGTQEARKRLNAESPEIKVAADLLRRATTPKSLFNLADTYNAANPQPKKSAGLQN